MALFSFLRFGLVLLLIGLFSPFTKNGFASYSIITTVEAARYISAYQHLEIIKFPASNLKFNDLHGNLLLPCTPSETENIQVTWYRNDELISNFRRNEFQVYENGTLRLPANEKSNGKFRCLVNGTKVELGALYSNLTTVVYPVLKRRNDLPTNFTAAIGDLLILDCPVLSIPSASISWHFSNASIPFFIPINDENSFTILKNGSLILKNIKEANKGRYKCIAHNSLAAKTHRQCIINVTIKSKSTTTATSINAATKASSSASSIEINSKSSSSSSSSASASASSTKNKHNNEKNNYEKLIPRLQEYIQYVRSGDNLILYCDTYKQDIKIAWTFLPTWSNRTYDITNHTKTIEIFNASVDSHEGIYNCSTRSDFQLFKLIVTIPPQIENPLISYEKQLANTVNLNCTATGKPEPEIIWYRNGIKLQNNYTIHINSSNLKIFSFDDTDVGVYQCFARNIAGETSSTSYLELKQKDIEVLPERPHNVKCYPINYRLMKITFESNHHIETININTARQNPSEWYGVFLMDTTQKQFLMTQDRIIFEPFMLYLRTIVLTGYKKFKNGKEEKHVEPSLMSEGVECATQGLEIHPVFFPNGIYIWWYFELLQSERKDLQIENFIVQIRNGESENVPEDSTKFANEIIGTQEPLKYSDRKYIEERLVKISALQQVPNSQNFLLNDASNVELINLIVSGNVTGILIPNTTKLSVRVIAITNANKHFQQDFRYMEWKNIERQGKQFAVPMVQSVEARSINFQWDPQLAANISCVAVCYQSTNLSERWLSSKGTCKNILTRNLNFTIEKLKPRWSLEFTFNDCETKQTFGTISELITLADPPGPISNFRIFKNNGYKLTWDEPKNPNGKIKAYLVEWTVNNSSTYQENVTATHKYFQLSNITENINISVRAFGENSLGLPIYVDLSKNIESIETEKSEYFDPVIGIAVGVCLSVICILCFISLYINQRKNFKTHLPSASTTTMQQYPTISTAEISLNATNGSEAFGARHIRISPTKMMNTNSTFSNRNSIIPNESSKRAATEFHEMQTLIPRQPNLNIISHIDHTSTILPPINDIFPISGHNGDTIAYYYRNGNSNDDDYENERSCPIALCSSTPLPQRSKSSNFNTKQLLDHFSFNKSRGRSKQKSRPSKNNKINKTCSSPDFQSNEANWNQKRKKPVECESKSLETNFIESDFINATTQPIDETHIVVLKQNGSIKNLIPAPNASIITKSKHSKSSSDSVPIVAVNRNSKHSNDRCSDVENKFSSIDSNSNTTPMENNSQYCKLIEDNNSSCDKNFSQNSTNNDSSNLSNCTATTLLNTEDTSMLGGVGSGKNGGPIIGRHRYSTGGNHVSSEDRDNAEVINTDTFTDGNNVSASNLLKEDANNHIGCNTQKTTSNKFNFTKKDTNSKHVDGKSEKENNLITQVNWNHRRPIIDPNG